MPDYIIEPINTDAEALFQEFVAYMQTQYPNWEASEAQLDVVFARWVSLKMAVIADMASRVDRAIYRYFGATVVNLPPIAAAPATGAMSITAIDTLGHTLGADTTIGIRDSLGDLHMFTTISDAIVPGGTTTLTNIALLAVEEGTDANSLSGGVEFVNQVDWIQSATVTAPTSGGIDAEDDDTYLNRLTTNFGLMAPRPVLAQDFALLSRNIAGIWRSAGRDNWLPGTNEQQTISHNYTATGATGGTISWNGQTTGPLAFNATAAQVQAAMEGLNNIEIGDIAATGGPWPAAITLEFKGRLAYTNVAQITASAGTWTGGTTITITTTVGGVAPNAAAENAVAVSSLDVGGNAIGPSKKIELDTYLQSLRQQNFIVNEIDPAFTSIDVTTTVVKNPQANASDVLQAVITQLTNYLSPASFGIPIWPPDQRGWDLNLTLRQQELYVVVNLVDGVDYASVLTFSAGAGATQDTSDKTLLGAFPMTRVGTISVTVV